MDTVLLVPLAAPHAEVVVCTYALEIFVLRKEDCRTTCACERSDTNNKLASCNYGFRASMGYQLVCFGNNYFDISFSNIKNGQCQTVVWVLLHCICCVVRH